MSKNLEGDLYNSQLFEMALRQLRLPLIMVVVSFAISMIGLVMIPGKNPAGELAYLTFFEAFYFTAYTASTIGYGEIPYPFTDPQRLWAIISIMLTVTSWFYALTKVIQIFTDKTVRDYFYLKSVGKEMKKIKGDFVIVVGYSRITKLLIEKIEGSRKDIKVIIIENDHEKLSQARADVALYESAMLVEASAEEKRVLRFVGIEKQNCIAIMSWLESDERILGISTLSKKLNPNIKIIIGTKDRKKEKNYSMVGVSDVINPYTIISENIYFRLKSPYAAVLAKWLRGAVFKTKVKPPRQADVLIVGLGNFGKSVEDAISESVRSMVCVDNLGIGDNKKAKYILGDITDASFVEKIKGENFTHIIITTDSDFRNYLISKLLFESHPEASVIVKVKDTENRFIWDSQKHEVWDVEKILAHESYSAILHQEIKTMVKILKDVGEVEAKKLYERVARDYRIPKIYEVTMNSEEAPEVVKRLRKGETVMLKDIFRSRENREVIGNMMPILYKSWKNEIMATEDGMLDDIELVEGAKILVVFENSEDVEDLLYAIENESELRYLIGRK